MECSQPAAWSAANRLHGHCISHCWCMCVVSDGYGGLGGGRDGDGGWYACRTKSGGLVTCRDLPEHFLSAR